MSDTSVNLTMYLTMFMPNLPKLIATVIALLIVLGRRQQLGKASPWALGGFGLLAVQSLLMPVTQIVVQSWLQKSGDYTRAGLIYSGLGLFWSVLSAVITVLLLVAIVTGRPKPAPAVPMPPQT